MKKIIILFIILTTCVFSQGWNTTVSTSISEPNLIKMDLFTNKDGNHIIVQNSNSTNSIKYYLLNSSGAVVRSSTIETAGGAEFPNISGDNDNVYLVYKSGNYLKAKKSTDAGQNWNNITIQPLSIGSNICNGVDIVYDYQGLHVVYAMKDNDPYYETYYYKLNSSNSWVDYKNVTDYNVDEVGGFPTVTVSSNRVHVSYNTGYSQNPGNQGDAKTRDKNGSAWENPQIVSSGANNLSSAEKLQVKGTTLFDFYYLFVDGGGNFGNSLMVKTRSTSGTTWSSATELGYNVDISPFMGSETTADQNLHIVYSDDSNLYHRQFSSYWNSTYTITSYPSAPYNTTFGLGKASNDLFCIWKPLSSNLLSFRQYDLAPLTPANLSISINSGDESVISWTANLEPDVKISGGKYKIYRAETTGGEPTSFTLVATIDAYSGDTPVTSWIDTESGKVILENYFTKYQRWIKIFTNRL